MKKIVGFILILMFTFFVGNKVFAYENEVDIREELGYSYNFVKDSYFEKEYVNIAKPIFNENWLKELIIVSSDINSGNTTSISETNINRLYDEVKKNLTSEIGISVNDYTAYATIKNRFSLTSDSVQEKTLSTFYHQYTQTIQKKRYALPNFMTNTSLYSDNLHDDFRNKINYLNYRLQNKTITTDDFNDFFDLYGTHIIHDVIYGARIDSNYTLKSNEVFINDEKKNSIISEINMNYGSIINGDTKLDMDIFNKSNYGLQNSTEKINVRTYGGIHQNFTSFSSFGDEIINWKNSISESNYYPIKVNNGGLLEIFNILPKNMVELKYEMKKQLNSYSDRNNPKKLSESLVDEVTLTKLIRSDIKKINDSGRFNQHFDQVNFDDSLNAKEAKGLGFKNFYLEISMDIREIDEGYQGVILYPNSKTKEESDVIAWEERESAKGDWVKHTFSFGSKNTPISIDRLNDQSSNIFIIRYGARGAFADDWENMNVKVKITYIK